MRPLFLFVMVSTAGAQALPPSPSFDAASVKQNHSVSNGMSGMIGIKQGGGLSMRNVPVRLLIDLAYDLKAYQLSGGPAWIASAGYDVEAKPEHPVDDATARLMLQNLLAERFSLRVHHEPGTVSGFNLLADKGGRKLKPSEAPGIGFRLVGPDKIQGPGDLRMLVSTLRGLLGVPVEDHTGIAGKFDIDLKWTRDDAVTKEPSVTILAAIMQELGLSLETTKVPIDKLVIDRVERPTEN